MKETIHTLHYIVEKMKNTSDQMILDDLNPIEHLAYLRGSINALVEYIEKKLW